MLRRVLIISALVLCNAFPATAGGPAFVAGGGFDPAVKGQSVTWAGGNIQYFTDQGDLSPILSGGQADTLVADVFTHWTGVPGVAITATLAGHLAEMIRASGDGVAVELSLAALPALAGAAELFAQGFASSLQPENLRARHLVEGMDRAADNSKLALLFDPQTAGGLLASLPAAAAAKAIVALRAAGVDAVDIGGVCVAEAGRPPIRLSSIISI